MNIEWSNHAQIRRSRRRAADRCAPGRIPAEIGGSGPVSGCIGTFMTTPVAPSETLLMTLEHVAEHLQVSRRTVETLVSSRTPKADRLKSLKVRGHRRVRRTDLLAYLDGLAEAAE